MDRLFGASAACSWAGALTRPWVIMRALGGRISRGMERTLTRWMQSRISSPSTTQPTTTGRRIAQTPRRPGTQCEVLRPRVSVLLWWLACFSALVSRKHYISDSRISQLGIVIKPTVNQKCCLLACSLLSLAPYVRGSVKTSQVKSTQDTPQFNSAGISARLPCTNQAAESWYSKYR